MVFLQDYVASQRRPPTRSQIAKGLGFRSANAAECHLRDLSKKGYVQVLPGVVGGIRLKKYYAPPEGS